MFIRAVTRRRLHSVRKTDMTRRQPQTKAVAPRRIKCQESRITTSVTTTNVDVNAIIHYVAILPAPFGSFAEAQFRYVIRMVAWTTFSKNCTKLIRDV